MLLGNISHALRTPLNAVIGFSDVLSSDDGSMSLEDRRQLLQLVNTNGQQLLHFINQLLELSEIETNNMPLERNVISLKEVMNSYADEYRGSLAEQVELHVEGDDIAVLADERYMRIVTKHFLSNAVHHTEQGSITLRYRLEDNGLRIEVQDTGNGLPEALRKNLFNLLSDEATFVQSEAPGLGLTICKSIIERCQGQIGSVSPSEGGTILWLWVPVKEVKREEVKSYKK